MSRSILLIDDDPEILRLLERYFSRNGWDVYTAAEPAAAADSYEQERPDIVLLDLQLPGISGLRLLEVLRARDAEAMVIMLTGQVDVATAVEAMQLGAENFLTKPVDLAHVGAAVDRAFEKVELRRRNRFFLDRQTEPAGSAALGASPIMRAVAREIELVAASSTTVLLLGETGTGKGYAAQLVHSLSDRAAAPLVDINCAGLSASFLDSEIFGHEKGAFTDAKEQKRGLLEVADHGTVFLDEIGDLAPELQPKLLKVLESQRFRRLGGTREIEVDVRIIAATNHDLEAAMRAGHFREDLYYRLAVLPLRMPPLRERGAAEIADLALRLLIELRRRLGRGPAAISPPALALLGQYAWPGNIRELRNVLERVLLLTDAAATEIVPGHLPAEIRGADELGAAGGADVERSLQELERRHIARVLAHVRGNRSRAARILGISRATLYDKIERFALGAVGRVTPGAGTSA